MWLTTRRCDLVNKQLSTKSPRTSVKNKSKKIGTLVLHHANSDLLVILQITNVRLIQRMTLNVIKLRAFD